MKAAPSIVRGRRRACWILVLALAVGAIGADENATPDTEPAPPANLERGWYARIETDFGTILARLLPEQAPQAVAYFAGLANGTLAFADPVTGEPKKAHYYDGIPIDRAVAAQRFEAGGLDGVIDRVPPELYLPPDEGHGPVNFSHGSRLGFTRFIGGRISAVKFFATAAGLPHLNYQHPCFGVVLEGRDVVIAISEVKTYSNGKPIEPVMLRRVRVFPVGDPEPLAEPKLYLPRPKQLEQAPNPAD